MTCYTPIWTNIELIANLKPSYFKKGNLPWKLTPLQLQSLIGFSSVMRTVRIVEPNRKENRILTSKRRKKSDLYFKLVRFDTYLSIYRITKTRIYNLVLRFTLSTSIFMYPYIYPNLFISNFFLKSNLFLLKFEISP